MFGALDYNRSLNGHQEKKILPKAGMVLNLSPIVVVETDDIAHIFVLFVSMILHRTVCCYASSALKTHVYTFPTSKLNKDTLT